MPSAPVAFDASGPWRLSPEVSLRDEAFGALAYHHGNRRLVFLKSPRLVALVRDLDTHACADDAISAHVDTREVRSYRVALASLAASEVICGN